MAGTKKSEPKEMQYRHREGAEWLTTEICHEYRKRALALSQDTSGDTGARRELKNELIKRCDVTELQALNILNGFHTTEYVRTYEMMRDHVKTSAVDTEYMEWLRQKEDEERNKRDDFSIEEDD